jgi:prepilin signal peptidase PulO-like enzyme (type II secretory pathway)
MLGLSVFGVVESSWQSHVIGVFIISVPFFVLAFFGAMGLADVQLMATAGLLLGWNIIPAALIGIFLGAVVGSVIKFAVKPEPTKIYDEGDGLPEPKGTVIRFGPFLAIGIFAAFLYGDEMIAWYMSFMSV